MPSRRQTYDVSVKAAIYARVSSDDGRQSTANQIQQLRELASVRQFEIIREYVDEETGASASRPAFLQLFRVSCISPYLTEHINRFGRYTLKRDRVPEPLEGARILKMPPRSESVSRTAVVAV
jgi:predicted site-specific integrase-resolvase